MAKNKRWAGFPKKYYPQKYVCDHEVYAYCKYGIELAKARWETLGKAWPVPDDLEFARILTAQAVQESALDKTGSWDPFCKCDVQAVTTVPKSSATGLLQVTGTTWFDIQDRIINIPPAEQFPFTDAIVPAVNTYLAACYMVHLYEYSAKNGTPSWHKALNHYHDGYVRKNAGATYANLILKQHYPKLNWENIAVRAAAGTLTGAAIAYTMRKEWK